MLAAIATNPQPAGPRVDLVRPAVEQKRYSLAIAAVEPLIPNMNYEQPAGEQRIGDWIVNSFLQGSGLEAPAKASIAIQLARAYQAQNDLGHAVLYYQMSEQLDPSAANKASTEKVLASLRTTMELRQKNEGRRPVITENLEEAVLVRPRLTAAGGAR